MRYSVATMLALSVAVGAAIKRGGARRARALALWNRATLMAA